MDIKRNEITKKLPISAKDFLNALQIALLSTVLLRYSASIFHIAYKIKGVFVMCIL